MNRPLTAALFLAMEACAPMQQRPIENGVQPVEVTVDPEIAACIAQIGGRRENSAALSACLGRIPTEDSNRNPESGVFTAEGIPVLVQEGSLGFQKEIFNLESMAGESTPTFRLLEASEVPTGENLTYQGPVVELNAQTTAPLDPDVYWPLNPDKRAVRTDGRLVEASGEQYSYDPRDPSILAVDLFDGQGSVMRWEMPFPGQEDDTNLKGLATIPGEEGKIALVVGDVFASHDNLVTHGGNAKGLLLVGSSQDSALRTFKFGTQEATPKPFHLNGGFLALNEKEWIVSAREGLIVTHDAGAHWEQAKIETDDTYGYTPERVSSYYVDLDEQGRIRLSLAYRHSYAKEDGGFRNYFWDQQRSKWVFTGPECDQESFMSQDQTTLWGIDTKEGAPTTYLKPGHSIPSLPIQAQRMTMPTNEAMLSFWHQSVDPTGEAPRIQEDFLHAQWTDGWALPWMQLTVSSNGKDALLVVPDINPGNEEENYFPERRIFMAGQNTLGEIDTVEIRVPETAGKISGAKWVEGPEGASLYVYYSPNPRPQDRAEETRLYLTVSPVAELDRALNAQ